MAALFTRNGDVFDDTTREKGCVAYDASAKDPTYGYVPHLEVGIIYTVVFAIIFVVTSWQTIRSRKWWYLALVLGVLGKSSSWAVQNPITNIRLLAELIGWASRIGAHYCPYNSSVFSLQISILIIGTCIKIPF